MPSAAIAWTTLYLSHPFRLERNEARPVVWGAALRVEPGSWSAENPTRIFTPEGFSWIELRAGICFQPDPTGLRQIFARRNGYDDRPRGYPPGYLSQTHPGGGATESSVSFSAESAIMPVAAGDYFELLVYHTADSALWVGGEPKDEDESHLMTAFGCAYFQANFY